MPLLYFSRCGRAGSRDVQVRAPELAPLRHKQIALFGLGCLGAPSAIEFAKAGIAGLCVIDQDVVKPDTSGRWPLGLTVAGIPKVDAVGDFIERNYPLTKVRRLNRYVGSFRPIGAASDMDVIADALAEVDLIYDATAELGVQHFLSDAAKQLSVPYVGVVGSYGGWGGKVLSIVPGVTRGCWHCYRAALLDGTIPEPPSDPAGEVQAAGCGDLSFTGAGFDMLVIAMTGVRAAVSVVCGDAVNGYPKLPGDVTTIALRDDRGLPIAASFKLFQLEKNKECPLCRRVTHAT